MPSSINTAGGTDWIKLVGFVQYSKPPILLISQFLSVSDKLDHNVLFSISLDIQVTGICRSYLAYSTFIYNCQPFTGKLEEFTSGVYFQLTFWTPSLLLAIFGIIVSLLRPHETFRTKLWSLCRKNTWDTHLKVQMNEEETLLKTKTKVYVRGRTCCEFVFFKFVRPPAKLYKIAFG